MPASFSSAKRRTARTSHQAVDRGERIRCRRGRSRLARRVSHQPIRARHQRRRRTDRSARRLRAIPDMDVAQCRRTRLRRLAARVQRSHSIERAQDRILRGRSLQPFHFDRSGDFVSRQGRSGGGEARASALRVLRSLRRRHASVRLRDDVRHDAIVRRRSRRAARRFSSPRGGVRATRRTHPAGRSVLRGDECGSREERGAVLPIDVQRTRVVMESARSAHGGDDRKNRRASSRARSRRQGRRLGAQLTPRRCARDGDGTRR